MVAIIYSASTDDAVIDNSKVHNGQLITHVKALYNINYTDDN